jgi:O-antigen/teichoic acid export membrane protein
VTEHEAGSDGRTLTRGIAANAATLAAMSVRGVMSIVIARVLGGDTLGAYLLAFAWMDVLSQVGVFGLDQAAMTFTARARGAGYPAAARSVFRMAAFWSVAISIMPMVAVWMAVAVGWPPAVRAGGLGLALALMAPTIPLLAIGRVCSATARGLRVMDVDFYAHGIAGTIVMLTAMALLLAVGMGEGSPSFAVTIGTFVAACVGLWLVMRLLARVSAGQEPVGPPHTNALLGFALPVAGTSILTLLLTRLDVLLLGFFVDTAPGVTPFTVGAYAAAAEWAGGLRKLRQVFDQAFAPIVAQALSSVPAGGASDAVTAQARLEQVARWILLLVCPIVGVTALSGGAALSIYGGEFRVATTWLIVLVVAIGSHGLLGLFETVIMVKRPSLNVVNALIAVAVQAALSIVLIPRIGALGAALGTLCAYAVQAALRAAEVRALEGWAWPWHAFALPVGASAVALVAGAVPRYFVAGLGGEAIAAGVFVAAYAVVVRASGLTWRADA